MVRVGGRELYLKQAKTEIIKPPSSLVLNDLGHMVQKIPFISPPLQRRVKLLPPPGNTVPSIPRARPAPVFHPPLRPLPLHLLGPFRLRLLTSGRL